MELFLLLLPVIVLIVFLVFAALAGERSIARQRGSRLRRGDGERRAAGRFLEKWFRW
jgi:hypothetical protein